MDRSNRKEDLALTFRRTAYQNPLVKIPRAGYEPPSKDFFDFKETASGQEIDDEDEQKPMFTIANACRGFQITVGDIFIIRFQVLKKLFQNDAFKLTGTKLKKFATNMGAELEQHPILQEQITRNDEPDHVRIPAAWYRDILKKWIQNLAADMRSRAKKNEQYAPGLKFPTAVVQYASHIDKSKEDAPYIPLHIMTILISLIGEEEVMATIVVFLEDVMRESDEEIHKKQMDTPTAQYIEKDPTIDLLELSKLKALITSDWKDALEGSNWHLTYLDPEWGNASLVIENDLQLQNAIRNLRFRGATNVHMRVSLANHCAESS
jgi:hypothetical protein